MSDSSKPEVATRDLVEAIREACIQTALDAYEQGGLAGLCAEGRWELAIDALRSLKVESLLSASEAKQFERK
ncbi:MAG: acetyltransferase [Anaerolineae bacterium]